jgi:hypothetical protein
METCLRGYAASAEDSFERPAISGISFGFRASIWGEVRQPRESRHARLKSGSSDKPGEVDLVMVKVTYEMFENTIRLWLA